MSLTKVNYIDNSTIITAQNLNDIQDNIIQNAELIKKASPRNLLDNSDFRNPVNQRGQDSYSLGSWGGYHIDRWYTGQDGADITFHTDGIHLTNTIVQPIENPSRLADKVVTLAVKINGEVCCGSGTVKYINGWSRVLFVVRDSFSFAVETTNDNGLTVVVHCGQQGVVEWAALYEGEYTIDTLPEYQPKGYGAELLACQTQLQRFHTESERKTYCEDFRPTMRMTPNGMVSKFEKEIDGVTYYFAAAEL